MQLLDSIKLLDARIDELKKLTVNGETERRHRVQDRMKSLIDTRFNLIYSFLDLNGHKNPDGVEHMNPFENFDIDYSDLKRKL